MSQDLLDFAILPHSRVQNYENKIEEQNSTIENLTKKVTHLENLVDKPEGDMDGQSGSEPTKISEALTTPKEVNPEPPPESNEIDLNNKEKTLPANGSKTEFGDHKEGETNIIKGKNINRQCLTRQLKEKLEDTNYKFPDNIDALLAAAVGTKKKAIPNEEEFYHTIISNNLISLVKNSSKFVKYIKPSFFKI